MNTFQAVVESDEVSPHPLLFQTKQAPFPQCPLETLEKLLEGDLATTSASSFKTLGCMPPGPIDLHTFSLMRCS